MTQHDFYTPTTNAYLICPNCGTFCCIDHEFKHGILPVKRKIILKTAGCGTIDHGAETEKMVSIPKK